MLLHYFKHFKKKVVDVKILGSILLCFLSVNLRAQSTLQFDSIRELTELNDPFSSDAYPWLSSDGLRLYYNHSVSGVNTINFTSRTNTTSYFDAPITVATGNLNPISFWLSSNELDCYACSNDTLFYVHRNSILSAFESPIALTLNNSPDHLFLSGASLNQAQDKLYLFLVNNQSLNSIVEFIRTSSTSFTYNQLLPLPEGFTANPGQLSKDDLTFMLGAKYNNQNNLLYEFTRTLPSDSFAIESFHQVMSINDTMVQNSQPSMAEAINYVAFVRASSFFWQANDLWIANKAITNTVAEKQTTTNVFKIFPNPSQGEFTVQCNLENYLICITDLLGQPLMQKQCNQAINHFYLLKQGVYIVNLKTNTQVITQKLVISN